MRLLYLSIVLPAALALPRASSGEISPGNKEKPEAAPEEVGLQVLTLISTPEEGNSEDEGREDVPEEQWADEPRLETAPEPSFVAPDRNANQFLLRHKANDSPVDPDHDAFLFTEVDRSRPVCVFFQHSVLGRDFGASTFPRISYVGSERLPYRVHYEPDDELHYESYRWPFAACNQGCELQALKIRAIFDWELNPVNDESPFDQATKDALMLAREICEWKNAHYHFGITDAPATRAKRSLLLSCGIAPDKATLPSAETVGTKLVVSGDAQAAIKEIDGIFRANKGPQDIVAMFHTVIVACQIHHYTTTPMKELVIGPPRDMVQEAMSQIAAIFAQTEGQIPVSETRDAIVRATQIYRYQEEGCH